MSTKRAGSRTAWASLAMVLAGAGRPSVRAKTLVEGWPVWIKGSHARPSFDVHAVSQAAEGIEPSRTPRLRVAWADNAGSLGVVAAGRAVPTDLMRRRGLRHQFLLHLSMWSGGKLSTRGCGARRGRMRISKNCLPRRRVTARHPGE